MSLAALEGALKISTTQLGLEGAAVTLFSGDQALGRGILVGGATTISPERKAGEGPITVVLDQTGYLALQLRLGETRPPPR